MTTQEQRTDTIAEMFPVPDGAKRLARFLGEWTVEGTLTSEGTPTRVTGTWNFVPAAGGWGIRAKFEGQADGLGGLDEDDLLGFDAETGLYHVYSLTNAGNVHDHVGGWLDLDRFELVCEAVQGGKPYREEVSITFRSNNEFAIHDTERVDAEEIASMDVTLRKR